ncbi:right-handed parallel beta-helix repeat-containing protein [Halorussus ruber]|uniref:right-handed parallel beta-helix repeat-containing protein n=1 Tax=Halorussus ruber TaxID=1126238 RepID=UPI0010922499|nr:right-handed parallel beta-helix repeat-containing protein [Halorussus ruber]
MNRVPTRTLAALLVLCVGLSTVGAPTVALPADALSADATSADTSASDVTFVESDITEDTTWTADGGPYRIAADVTIAEGATLVVEPGAVVQPAADISLVVEGNLSAEGTAQAPITFSPAPEAPSRVRWGSIRYEGSAHSRLSLSHVVLERATNGLTVDSAVGRVDVRDATVRRISRHGVRVVHDTGTPKLTIEDSTFAAIGGRGVAVTPGRGPIGEFGVTSNSTEPGNTTEHQLAVSPGGDTTMDTFRVSYRGHGEVGDVERGHFRTFGLDLNNNGTVDWSLWPLVSKVETGDNAYELRLRRAVTVPGDATVRVAYNHTENPQTYGTYPIAVDFRRHGVSQTAKTTVPFRLHSAGYGPDRRMAGRPPEETRATRISVTGSTFEQIGEQGVFVSADATRNVRLAGNAFSDSQGSAIALRGRRVRGATVARNRISAVGDDADGIRVATRRAANLNVRENRISEADAGVGLSVRNENADGVRIADNTLTRSTTGVRVRHRVARYAHRLSMTLADNEISDNRRHGVSVVTEATRLRGAVRGNNVTGNGAAGVLLDGDTVSGLRLRNNTVEENADGVRLRANRLVNSAVADNTIADNRGHGFSVRTRLVVHDLSVADNRVLDNAGIGLNVDNELTHAGRVTLTRNVVAANAYGIRLAGAFGGRILDNAVVFNTYGLDAPRSVPSYRPGTGIVVEEGDAGAIFRAGEVDEELAELVDDQAVESDLEGRRPDEEYTVVLRPNRSGYVWNGNRAALAVRSVSEDLPTGVVLRKGDENRQRVVVRGNDVYGHDRGMVVNVSTLVDANTTTRLFVNSSRTVLAERNYWGAESGPTHASIHPEGTGDRVVTRAGWVDFVPSSSSPNRQRYSRPVPNVTISSGTATGDSAAVGDSVTVGDSVVLSGRASSDRDGQVAFHRFVVKGPENATVPSPIDSAAPNATVSFEETGQYTISLVVADEMGVESADSATATVRVREQGATTTASPGPGAGSDSESALSTSTPSNATTVGNSSANSGSEDGGLLPSLSVFTTLGGLLGLVFYLAALALGAFGVIRSVQRAGVPVSGKVINGLAAVGVLVWVVFGLLGTGGLLAVGVGGGVLWVALVALLWLLMG